MTLSSAVEKYHQYFQVKRELSFLKRKADQMKCQLLKSHLPEGDPRSSGVLGIELCIKRSRGRAEQYEAGFLVMTKARPVFFRLSNENQYSACWQQAVDFWADLYRAASSQKVSVLGRPPAPAGFKEIRKNMQADGKVVPIEILSVIFKEQREKLAKNRTITLAPQQALGGKSVTEHPQLSAASQELSEFAISLQDQIQRFERKRA